MVDPSLENNSVLLELQKFAILPNETLKINTPDFNNVLDVKAEVQLVEGNIIYYGVIDSQSPIMSIPSDALSFISDLTNPTHFDLYCP